MDNAAARKAEAERRRNLEGNILYQDLGEPIQKLLQAVSMSITNEELALLSKVSVRLLTKVFNMLNAQEDPDKILSWLREEAKRQSGGNKVDPDLQKQIAKDPIAFYRELEKRNEAMLESFRKAEEERERERLAGMAERKRRREEAERKAKEDAERAAKNGDTTDAVDRLNKQDAADIAGAFNRFVDKNGTFDNTNATQDTEWWKKDEYRRDYEKNKRKGKAWTRVVEGGTQQIPESEIAAREEWYKSYCWWKTDKFRRDWLASRDAEWWKEETYIKEWQDKGDKGCMWLAADETTGFNRKGHRRPAAKAELERRVSWYRDNGPKGIVKMWCALAEGQQDRCTLEEKRERDDYYKNGDWWKSDGYVRKAFENAATCEAIRFAGAAAEDREWWKDEKYRRDFCRDGKRWKLANERAAVEGREDLLATEAELSRRQEWFQNNWWKTEALLEDYQTNGEKGMKWIAANESDLAAIEKDPRAKISVCSVSDRRVREDWFKSAEERHWWKDPTIIRDWEQNGKAGKKWTAAWREAALDSTGDQHPADGAELALREEWFKKNFWKTDKYIKDFQSHGNKGTAWKAANRLGHEDKDWWKQGEMQKSWLANHAATLTPFWQEPEAIADYYENGAAGKRWPAKNAAAAEMEKGDQIRAPAEELAEREAFYQNNWWRAPQYKRDFAANGKHGKLWRAAAPNGEGGIVGTDELRRRREFFAPSQAKKHSPPFTAMLESDALNALANSKFSKWSRLEKREEFYKKNWWKVMPEVKADFLLSGPNSKLLKAKTPEAAAAGLGDDPAFQASPEEIQERIDYFQSGASEDTTAEDSWWKDGAFAKEWAGGRTVPFWQNQDIIQDYLDNGASGKKWTAKTAAAAASSLGDQPTHRADNDELAKREEFFRKNFWQATKYQDDFETNGEKGTLWTMTEPAGKGEVVSSGELNARQAWYKPTMKWQLAEKPEGQETASSADAVEVIDRDEWFKKNWWKNPIVKNDYIAHGKASKLLRAANADVVILGLQDDPAYQASNEEIDKRIEYFETCGDNEWWKAPAAIEDYVKWHNEGAVWQSRNLVESQMSMGIENPAPAHELAERSEWYESNYWKTPDAIRDYQTNGNSGSIWKAGRDGTTPVAPSELPLREAWLKANACCDSAEESRRKTWLQQQLTDDETVMRRQWLLKKAADAKRIHVDELPDLLAQINDGLQPTDDQVQQILDAIRDRRSELANSEVDEVGEDGITQEEFVTAVATTNFYVPATDEERLRAEQEALDALQREEMERQDEVAGHLAMEAQEELDNAGFEEHEEVDGDEAAFLDEMEEEDLGDRVNEDDDEVDEGAWQEFLEQQGEDSEELTDDQLAALQAEEEERQAAEAARLEAEAAVWEDGEYGGEEGEDDAVEHPADLDEDAKEELEAVVNEEWDEVEDDEEYEEEEEIDEMQMEEKGTPMQWKLPLREVTNPQYLKAYFTVIKYTPSHSFLGGKQKRVWVVDHFTRCFYNLEKSGKIKKEHAANKLLQLERNLVDCTRLRLMFFDASHSYELQFFNARERERFYETASAIRPSIRVYAPDLTNQDANVEACTTTIDGVGPNSVSVVCNNAQGKPVNRELTGECKVNASKLITEPLTVWVGTFNLAGARPPKNKQELAEWMPKDKHDIYAIAVQEASYRKEESEWFDYVQAYLGREYLTLASMNLWDTLLIVLTRKKHLLKITNVEGSTKATVHKAVCGTKGGIGISLRYLETSMCFITCHLAARIERTQMRNTNLEEIVDNLQLGIRETDFTNQFNHVFFFGDFNYRTEIDAPTAERLIADKNYADLISYDQFTQQRMNEGILAGFTETPITFAPTYRLQPGTGKYMIEKGNASSYCDRVLTRSMTNTWIKCTSYKSVPSITFSEHTPVCATYIVRCVRPVLSCFMKSQRPIPVFHFKNIAVKDHTGVIINKPCVIISSPFFGSTKPFESKTTKTQNPAWSASEIPSHESITQVQELIETGHIIFILREGAEKREDKAHRGSGHLPMLGHVVGQEGVEQDFEVDLMNHGRRMGKIVGRYMWVAAK